MSHQKTAVKTKYNGKDWICEHCGAIPEALYIATGHDHTDGRLDLCTCGNGEDVQTAWKYEAGRYAGACPEEYKKK